MLLGCIGVTLMPCAGSRATPACGQNGTVHLDSRITHTNRRASGDRTLVFFWSVLVSGVRSCHEVGQFCSSCLSGSLRGHCS
jgi:hypothetical protein